MFFPTKLWASLLERTVPSMSVAAMVGLVVVNFVPRLQRSEQEQLVRQVAVLLIPMILMPFLGA
ncbi:MAG: hypothetical protein MUC83_00205 [Pirellula sp.]|nr:hypothetical protein [Pirellula sp.]